MAEETVVPLAFNVKRAAHYTGMSRSKLYEFIADGQLKSFLVGGRRMFLQDDLLRFVLRLRGAA
jgi:excisionase family DNA binding protein